MNEFKRIGELIKIDLSLISPTNDAEISEWERKQEEERLLENYRKTVPERYRRESFKSFMAETDEQKKALQKAKLFSEAVKQGRFRTLVLLGSVGTGKTHLACGIIRESGGTYRLSSEIVEELRRAKSFSATETESRILDFYGNTSLLVIDEIARVAAENEEKYMLYQVINERYNRQKSTALISNQTKKEFLSYVGLAAADRLSESAEVVEFSGKSFRSGLRKN